MLSSRKEDVGHSGGPKGTFYAQQDNRKGDQSMLESKHLQKTYTWKPVFRPGVSVLAVRDVSLQIRAGETVGLVGESGCGKSTLARCLAGLEQPSDGGVFYHGEEISRLSLREARVLRKRIQYIFQNPVNALNPYRTVAQLIAEPLQHFRVGNQKTRMAAVQRLLDMVELPIDDMDKYPAELSRGECQRVNIARALILEPEIIICDEVISALDVSIGVQILHLLKTLQRKQGYGFLFISHDISRVIQISDWIAVMYMGLLMEWAPAAGFHAEALHPYSQVLLQAVPSLIPGEFVDHPSTAAEIPDPVFPQHGCPFHTRCPYATDVCRREVPAFRSVGQHTVRCHHAEAVR